jgi:hypothetical protein
MRPLWLSRPEQRADVLIGNPPWIAYQHLSAEMKLRLRSASRQMNLWVGGVLATQQDMSALFWARGAERCLKPDGTIAFVLPFAAGSVADVAQAADAGYRHLAAWLRDAEAKWRAHSNKRSDGTPRMTLNERVDHMRGLLTQLTPLQIRVVYTKAGTLLSAQVLGDPCVIVDTTAYWAPAHDMREARYLFCRC